MTAAAAATVKPLQKSRPKQSNRTNSHFYFSDNNAKKTYINIIELSCVETWDIVPKNSCEKNMKLICILFHVCYLLARLVHVEFSPNSLFGEFAMKSKYQFLLIIIYFHGILKCMRRVYTEGTCRRLWNGNYVAHTRHSHEKWERKFTSNCLPASRWIR